MYQKRYWILTSLRSCNNYCQKQLSTSISAFSRPVRLRFAPSPTGQLHLGGFRTALLNYLFAVKKEGKFILRIEDTDQTRLVPGALQMIETDLNWLGINPHEGPSSPGQHGPYIQSQRLSLYQDNLGKLVESGHAYECFCTEKRLELMRREAMRLRQKPRYDNKCRDLTREEITRKKAAGEKYCVRFKLEPEHVKFKDLVYGDVEYDLTGMNYEGDPVIVKSDGYPTYHFANVVDDHYMEISHVLRGVEWQVSTPKHLQMYRAFNWNPPEYAHLPLVVNKDGTKLSKRQGDISISHYRGKTYYPGALANFVTKSGGGFLYHGVDQLYNLNELAQNFNIGSVNKSDCRLDFALLEKLNQLELSSLIQQDLQSVVNVLLESMKSEGLNSANYPRYYLEKVLRWCPDRASKVKDLISPDFEYLWSQPNPSILSKIATNIETIQDFKTACEVNLFGYSDDITDSSTVSGFLEEFCAQHKLRQKNFFKDLRIILCGIMKGPPIVDIFHLFGKKMISKRLTNSLEYLIENAAASSQKQGTR